MQLRIITTGGTIDKVYFDATSDYQVGQPAIVDLLNNMAVNFSFTVSVAFQKDSLDMTAADRIMLRDRVRNCSEDHVLITHGTDSMVATALTLIDIPDKCIVLTGAMQPAAFINSDAVFNIGCALGAVQSKPAGVYIAMNGSIFDADRVCKNVAKNIFEEI
jgi:L-asparaginase